MKVNVLKYKNFIGTVQYSADDGIDDLVSLEGLSMFGYPRSSILIDLLIYFMTCAKSIGDFQRILRKGDCGRLLSMCTKTTLKIKT